MAIRGRLSFPTKRRAKFAKGELPDWIDCPGVLMRATACIIKVAAHSQLPGVITSRPLEVWEEKDVLRMASVKIIARASEFGLYLGKHRVLQKMADGREINVPVPVFWFNGFKIVFTTLKSYENAVVSDDVYDDWHSQQQTL